MDARFRTPIPPAAPLRLPPGRDARQGLDPSEIDWEKWSRHFESRRRRLGGRHPFQGKLAEPDYLAEASYVSFRLEGLDVSEAEVHAAVARIGPRPLRSRSNQRVRNHAALIRFVDRAVITAHPLDPAAVVRWYASISSGLCPPDPGEAPLHRLALLVQRINSPELRLAAAVQEISRLHVSTLTDPIVPSFNGIIARLLLRYNLGRCGLPPVIFHPDTPPAVFANVKHLLPLLMEQLEHSFDVLLA